MTATMTNWRARSRTPTGTPRGDFSTLRSLTPEGIAVILDDVRRGECPADYPGLARDIELRGLHYRPGLSTRKDAIIGLEIKIIPAYDVARYKEIFTCIEREIIKNQDAKPRLLIRDMTDAPSEVFFVNEIIRNTRSARRKSAAHTFRVPLSDA